MGLRIKVDRVIRLGKIEKALKRGNPFRFNKKDYNQLKKYIKLHKAMYEDL